VTGVQTCALPIYTLEELEERNHDDPERMRLTPAAHPGSPPAPAPAAPLPADVPWLTPLAEAAAAAFPRLDLTADEARRLAQGAKLELPAQPVLPAGPPGPQDGPVAAFDPDGALVALVTAESGRLRSLAVFAGAS
jgi:hypothetical protein